MNAALTHEQFLEAVRILAQPAWTDIASVIVAAVVGVVQAGILVWGIRTMTTESVKRDRRHADRHAETMEALRTQHTGMMETLRQQGDAFRAQGDAFRTQGDALRILIERTAPPRAGDTP